MGEALIVRRYNSVVNPTYYWKIREANMDYDVCYGDEVVECTEPLYLRPNGDYWFLESRNTNYSNDDIIFRASHDHVNAGEATVVFDNVTQRGKLTGITETLVYQKLTFAPEDSDDLYCVSNGLEADISYPHETFCEFPNGRLGLIQHTHIEEVFNAETGFRYTATYSYLPLINLNIPVDWIVVSSADPDAYTPDENGQVEIDGILYDCEYLGGGASNVYRA